MTAKMLEVARLREALEYDCMTGEFRWKIRPACCTAVGSKAGSNHGGGYRRIKLDGCVMLAHRLAWAMHHGKWPDGQIDHKNGIRSDNRIENLRAVSHAENCQNLRECRSDNKSSGLLGVCWMKDIKRWRARIKVGGVQHSLGHFLDKHDAHAAYVEAKRRLHSGGLL